MESKQILLSATGTYRCIINAEIPDSSQKKGFRQWNGPFDTYDMIPFSHIPLHLSSTNRGHPSPREVNICIA
ncbi:hypothetical protein N9D38_10460, partial [Rubripirellula sp.]|nr:hypothetical protein [Rubripirellula sp.]